MLYTQNAMTDKLTKIERPHWKSTRDLEAFPLPRLWHRARVKRDYLLLRLRLWWARMYSLPKYVPYTDTLPKSDWPPLSVQEQEEEEKPAFPTPTLNDVPSGEYVRTWNREYSDKHQTPATATTAALKRLASEEQDTQRMPVIPKSLKTIKLTQKDIPYYTPLPIADAEAYRKMGVGITAEGDQFLLDEGEQETDVWPALARTAPRSKTSG